MDINKNLGNLMKEAQAMQDRMRKAQQQLSELTVTGEAGGGMVKITITCQYKVKEIYIHPSLMEEDPEMLADLLMAAWTNAGDKIEKISKEKISQLTAGLNIPTDFMGEKE